MRDDDDFGFDDDGELAMPTMRGNANLNPQDYARGPRGRGSSILDNDLQEDTRSTPGRNPGAASAPDVDGTDDWTISDAEDGPGMDQTTFGAHPWGPGGAAGYRPHSMARTDQSLRNSNLGDADPPRAVKPVEHDDMHREPEVLNAPDVVEVPPSDWGGNRNQMPSNSGIPEDTIYDRESYEYSDSSQDTVGSGIFGMEEGVTWRARDGVFAHQYALPAYIGDEDEMGVQQSEMWDTTANEPRVTQVSASGVALKRGVKSYKEGYSPFVGKPVPEMRPEVTGPRSHVEAFGRDMAKAVIAEAQTKPPIARSQFIAKAVDSLGTGTAGRVAQTAQKLVASGQEKQSALEDSIAHAVMGATAQDLQSGARANGQLPRLDRLANNMLMTRGNMQASAARHIAPLTRDTGALKRDLGQLYASPAALGMGQVAPAALSPSSPMGVTLFTPQNMAIAGIVGLGGYFLWKNRRAVKRNAKKLARKVGIR